jgi:hypothetical protein
MELRRNLSGDLEVFLCDIFQGIFMFQEGLDYFGVELGAAGFFYNGNSFFE